MENTTIPSFLMGLLTHTMQLLTEYAKHKHAENHGHSWHGTCC